MLRFRIVFLTVTFLTVGALSMPVLAKAAEPDAEAGGGGLAVPGQQALEYARSGTAVQWVSPDNGATMTVVPQPAFQTPGGQICREFQQTVMIGGQAQQAYGTACRQADGSWKLAPQRATSNVVTTTAYEPPPTVVIQPPPRVVYVYPPIYPVPVYYPTYYGHPRPVFYSRVFIGSGRPHHPGHHHRW
ncbi:MAG: hypothetical protein U1E97_03270 [Alphaproteobacteria bacterium]